MTANRIYFAQHGLAVDKAEDPERPLSDAGISQTQAVAQQLVLSGACISKIFHSGKLRTKQTAEIFASTLDIKDISAADNFSPDDDVRLTKDHLEIEDALYVGHLPHLDKLTSSLISGDEAQGIIKFQNSAVACLEKSKSSYQVIFYLTQECVSKK